LMFTARREKNCGDADADSLFAAAVGGDLARVKQLVVGCGADPNIQNKDGWTPLHYAAWQGHHKVVELLLEHGANPNIQKNDGETPLHFTVDRCLLNKYGRTPLHFTVSRYHHVDMVRVLLDHGADPTIRDNKGRTPLDYGSLCEEIIEELRRRSEIIEELRRRSGATAVYE